MMTARRDGPILGLIPARGGSKGIPRKNLVLVNGRPLLRYTTDEALRSRRLDRVLLSTDDPEIAGVGRAAGVEVPFLRPSDLATDGASVEDVVRHALDWLRTEEGYRPGAFVTLHPTTPLRRAEHIDQAIDLWASSPVDAVVSVSPPLEHPCDMVRFADDQMHFLMAGGYAAGQQRQGYPECYFINGAIYVTRTDAFAETGTRFGRSVRPYLMDALDSVDIDSSADLVIAELLLQRRERSARAASSNRDG